MNFKHYIISAILFFFTLNSYAQSLGILEFTVPAGLWDVNTRTLTVSRTGETRYQTSIRVHKPNLEVWHSIAYDMTIEITAVKNGTNESIKLVPDFGFNNSHFSLSWVSSSNYQYPELKIPQGFIDENGGKLVIRYKYNKKNYPYPDDDFNGWTQWYNWTDAPTRVFNLKLEALQPTITGPEAICNEGTYTVTNAASVTLENATGIATLTDLGNGQWKVTRTGDGEVVLKATNAPRYYNQTIKVGTPAFSVLGSNIIDTGNWIFDVDNTESVQDVVWSISAPNNTVQLTPFNNNKSVKVTVSNWSYFGNNFFNLNAKITSTCGEIKWSSRSLGKKGDEEYADQ